MYFNDQNTQFPLLQTEPRKLYTLSTFLFQAGFSTIPHNLLLQITWTNPLPHLSTIKI